MHGKVHSYIVKTPLGPRYVGPAGFVYSIKRLDIDLHMYTVQADISLLVYSLTMTSYNRGNMTVADI